MAGNKQLRLVLVTPEKTLLDQPVDELRFPLYDGQMGVLPGRAPLVGRLGVGELHFKEAGGGQHSYFIDGGFVQVKGTVVSVLTNAAMLSSEISRKSAGAKLQEAKAELAKTDIEYVASSRRLEKARKMLALASKD